MTFCKARHNWIVLVYIYIYLRIWGWIRNGIQVKIAPFLCLFHSYSFIIRRIWYVKKYTWKTIQGDLCYYTFFFQKEEVSNFFFSWKHNVLQNSILEFTFTALGSYVLVRYILFLHPLHVCKNTREEFLHFLPLKTVLQLSNIYKVSLKS